MDIATAWAVLNWWAILAATLSAFVLGGLWYSPVMFQRAWQRHAGITEDQLSQGNMPLIFGLAFALQLAAAIALGLFLGPGSTLAIGASAGFMVGLLWVGTALGVIYLFERRPLPLYCINGGYQLVLFVVMGAIIGAWH